VKMTLRSLAVALLLTAFSMPATLMALTCSSHDNAPPPIVHPSPMPPDGNPFPHVVGGGQ